MFTWNLFWLNKMSSSHKGKQNTIFIASGTIWQQTSSSCKRPCFRIVNINTPKHFQLLQSQYIYIYIFKVSCLKTISHLGHPFQICFKEPWQLSTQISTLLGLSDFKLETVKFVLWKSPQVEWIQPPLLTFIAWAGSDVIFKCSCQSLRTGCRSFCRPWLAKMIWVRSSAVISFAKWYRIQLKINSEYFTP